VTISKDKLLITNPSEIRKLRHVQLSTRLSIYDNTLIVALVGHPYLYLIDINEHKIRDEIKLSYFKNIGFEVVKRDPFGYGFRTPTINTAVFNYNDNIYTSHGRLSNDDNPTMVIYDPVLKLTRQITDYGVESYFPISKILNGNLVIHELMEARANYLEIYKKSVD